MNTQINQMVRAVTTMMAMDMSFGMARPVMLQWTEAKKVKISLHTLSIVNLIIKTKPQYKELFHRLYDIEQRAEYSPLSIFRYSVSVKLTLKELDSLISACETDLKSPGYVESWNIKVRSALIELKNLRTKWRVR